MQIQTTIIDHLLLGWYDALHNEAFLLQIVVRKPVRFVIENGDINGLPYGGHPPAHSAAYTHRSTGARGRLGGVNIQTLSSRLYTNPEDRTREAVFITACACSTVDGELARRVGSASRHPRGRKSDTFPGW